MAPLFTIDELLSRVSELTRNLPVQDGRVADQFTERNVRYYVTQGYVRPPVRQHGKSMWNEEHVKDLLRIRRAQSAGQSLAEIGKLIDTDLSPKWKLANIGVNRSQVAHHFETSSTDFAGWAMQISHNIQLSGFTNRRPTQEEIERVTRALASLIISNQPDTDQQQGQS